MTNRKKSLTPKIERQKMCLQTTVSKKEEEEDDDTKVAIGYYTV